LRGILIICIINSGKNKNANNKYTYYSEDDSEDSDTVCETIVNCEKCSKEVIFDYHLESKHAESAYIRLLKFETISMVCDLLDYPRINFKGALPKCTFNFLDKNCSETTSWKQRIQENL
jgi:hypothetical protein